MKLDAWMQQDLSLDESLRLIEGLSQAVNEVHDRGEALGGLQPNRIEVDPEGRCDLSEARGAAPSPDYAPPDGEGDSAADVYAVGRIAWEILAGRPAGESPRHLSEVRPDIAKELADAIMACLEESADWRPKDLTFLAQMAAARQKGATRAPRKARGPARTSRRTPTRTPRSRRQGRRTWPLLAALVVVLGLAVFAWRQFAPGGLPGAGTPAPPQAPPPVATPTPASPVAEPAPTDASPSGTEAPAPPQAGQTAADEAAIAPPAVTPPAPSEPAAPAEPALRTEPPAAAPPPTRPAPAVEPPARTAPSQQSPPTAPPAASRPAPSSEPPVSPAPAAPPPVAPPTSRPQSPPAPRAETEPSAPAPPAAPAVLSAVSPLEVKRPGKVMLDLRGQGFLDQHRVQIIPLKKAPRGISVVRHKRTSDGLITVLIDLTDEAEPGEYAIALEDAFGNRTEPLTFTVTK